MTSYLTKALLPCIFSVPSYLADGFKEICQIQQINTLQLFSWK